MQKEPFGWGPKRFFKMALCSKMKIFGKCRHVVLKYKRINGGRFLYFYTSKVQLFIQNFQDYRLNKPLHRRTAVVCRLTISKPLIINRQNIKNTAFTAVFIC